MNAPVYLDHNATSPIGAEVADIMAETALLLGNASSVHAFGRDQRNRVEAAREEVAALVGATPDRVIFTSGGTEANNLALSGGGRHRVVASSLEHDSVLQAGPELLPARPDGVVEPARLSDLLAEDAAPALVSVMLANNETGVIQPVAELAVVASRHGAIVHTDAVQAAGRIPIDLPALGVAMATLSAHKIGGPQGVGALVLGVDIDIAAQIRGGGQERARRAGTENVAGIAGFGVAARLARAGISAMAETAALRDRMESRLRAEFPDAVVFGDDAPRLANTSCFAVPGLRAETQVMALDLAGVAVSAGSACSSGKVTPSHVLQAMGVAGPLAACAIRVSFGARNRDADIERLVAALVTLRQRAGRAA